MPTGTRWWPIFRITPTDGDQWEFDTRTQLTTPAGVMAVNGPLYKLVQDVEEDVLRDLQPINHGWRCELSLDYAVNQDMVDHDLWIRLINALRDREHNTVELSLDQGQTYRVVDMIGEATESPVENRTYAGFHGRLPLKVRSLIAERVSVTSVTDQEGYNCGW